MDRNHAPEVSAGWAAICKRHDGRRVGGDRATFAAGQPARPSARDALAHGSERDLLHRPELLPVAHAAEGVSAIHDGAALLLPLARRRHLAEPQSRASDQGTRAGGARGEPYSGRHRQPVGEDDGGRWPARLRCRQEDQRPQAPFAGRHDGVAHRGHRTSRRHSGSRRRPAAARYHAQRSAMSSPTAAMPAASFARPSPSLARGPSTSSGAPMPPRASSLCRDDGSSSAPSPGSIAIAASPKTSKRPSKAPRRGSSSPASSCSPAASPGPDAQPIRICVSLVYFQCLQADFSKSLGASWTLLVHTAPRSSMAASNIPPRAISARGRHARGCQCGSLQAECLATRCIACTRRPAVEAPGANPERMHV
jgi:hypothetical protein